MVDPFDKKNIVLMVLRLDYQNGLPMSNITRI